MAHSDYDCCAVCDSKMSYSYDSLTKERICSYCVASLAKQGVIVQDVDELKEWIKETPKETVREVLKNAGYQRCFFENDVDELIEKKGIKIENDRIV